MSALIHHRLGGWLPQNHSILATWIDKRTVYCDAAEPELFLPVIRDFQKLIEGDGEIFMGFHRMFEQVPTKPPYNEDPTGKPQVRYIQLIFGVQ
jgi:phosphatidylserine decarboxylase